MAEVDDGTSDRLVSIGLSHPNDLTLADIFDREECHPAW